MRTKLLLSTLIVLISIGLSAQVTEHGLRTIIQSSPLKSAQVGIAIHGIDNSTYAGYQDEARLATASTIKLLTTLVALDRLGSDYQYTTSVEYTGTITNKTLTGNIILRASGDPTLGTHREGFANSLDEVGASIRRVLEKAGIECVEGDIIIDIGNFEGQGVRPQWLWEDLGNYYGSGVYPMNIHENLVHITFGNTSRPYSPTTVASVRPSIAGLSFDNHVTTSTHKGRDKAYVFGAPNTYHRSIRGSIPSRKHGFTIKGSMPYPPYDAGTILRNELKNVFTTGDVKVVSGHNAKTVKLGVISSPRLREITTLCNRKSINLYADALLLSLARQSDTWSLDQGVRLFEDRLTDIGVDPIHHKIHDGCGLSPFTTFSAKGMVQAIAAIIRLHPSYVDIIPRVEKNGVRLLRDYPISGRLYLKSGSMSGVLGYAGVYISPRGKRYAIHMAANHYKDSYGNTRKVFEEVLKYCLENVEK